MYRIIKPHAILIVFFVIAGRVYAQQPANDTLVYSHHLVRSVGFSLPALNYSLLSPLNHSGYALGAHSNRFRNRKRSMTQFQLHFEIGLLYNKANDSYITSLAFDVDRAQHWHVTDKTKPLRFLCGFAVEGGVDIFLKENNTNNPVAYFFNLSVSPTIMGKYRFTTKKITWELGQQLDIPVSSLVSLSGYSTSMPYPFLEKDANFFDAMRLASFGSFWKVSAITGLDIIPSKKNLRKIPAFRINYMFTGMRYNADDLTVKAANHAFLFGAIFRLFR